MKNASLSGRYKPRIALILLGLAAAVLTVTCRQSLYQWPSVADLSYVPSELELFGRRVAVTVDNAEMSPSRPSETLTDVPVAIFLDSSKIDTSLLTDDPQIRIYDESVTRIFSHEIETWDPDGVSVIWVKVPELPANGSARFYLYYDYRGMQPLTPSPSDVFSNGYAGVWHFSESHTGWYRDSSGNGKHGDLSTKTVTYPAPGRDSGKLGAGLKFYEEDQGVVLPALSMEDLGSVTVSMWVAPVSFENADRFFYRDNFDVFYSASREFVKMEMRMSGSPIIIDTPQKLSPPPSPSAWKWYNFRWNGKLPDSSDSRLYYAPFAGDEPISGINRYGGSGTPLGDAGSDTILGNVPGGPPWGTPLHAPEAHFDEVRISSVVRSPHWIHIQYRSMTDALLTFDEEEAL